MIIGWPAFANRTGLNTIEYTPQLSRIWIGCIFMYFFASKLSTEEGPGPKPLLKLENFSGPFSGTIYSFKLFRLCHTATDPFGLPLFNARYTLLE